MFKINSKVFHTTLNLQGVIEAVSETNVTVRWLLTCWFYQELEEFTLDQAKRKLEVSHD